MEKRADGVQQVNVPSEHIAVVAMFSDRDAAEAAIDALHKNGFTDDQISLVARGAGTDGAGKFVPRRADAHGLCEGSRGRGRTTAEGA
jgi:hypothetical protein